MTSQQTSNDLLMEDLLRQVTVLSEELLRYQPIKAPDYSKEGLEALYKAAALLMSRSSRATHILASTTINLQAAEQFVSRLDDDLQVEHDQVVVGSVDKLDGKSWSERESFYRVRLVEHHQRVAKAKRVLAQLQARAKVIEICARQINSERYDVAKLVDILRTSEHIGEL